MEDIRVLWGCLKMGTPCWCLTFHVAFSSRQVSVGWSRDGEMDTWPIQPFSSLVVSSITWVKGSAINQMASVFLAGQWNRWVEVSKAGPLKVLTRIWDPAFPVASLSWASWPNCFEANSTPGSQTDTETRHRNPAVLLRAIIFLWEFVA